MNASFCTPARPGYASEGMGRMHGSTAEFLPKMMPMQHVIFVYE